MDLLRFLYSILFCTFYISKVTFPEGDEANLGNTLQVSKAGKEPIVQFDSAVAGQKYTICKQILK